MNSYNKVYALFAMLLSTCASSLPADELAATTGDENFFVRGDFLYWSPQVSGLELGFGSSSLSQNSVDDTQVIRARELDLDPTGNWSAGYRAAIGYRLNTCPWQIEAVWTDYSGEATKSSLSNEGSYRVRLGQFDALMAHTSSLSPSVSFKPFFGIRAARIHQKVQATVLTTITIDSTPGTQTQTLDDRQTYYGVGPLVGFQADWDMGAGFGLYGSLAAGLLYGKFDVHLNDTSVCTLPSSRDIASDVDRRLKSSDCNIDWALGLYWHSDLSHSMKSTVNLSFEHHEYFNQNRMGLSRGDLSFNGCALCIGLDF